MGERRSTDGVPTEWVVAGTVESGWRKNSGNFGHKFAINSVDKCNVF